LETKRGLLLGGIALGSLLTLSPLFGWLGTIFILRHALDSLGNTGINDLKAASTNISMALFSTATGLVLYPVGLIILSLSLVFFFRQRAATPPLLPLQR
jgi:biopolymer transport protein ExbB/TolQ